MICHHQLCALTSGIRFSWHPPGLSALWVQILLLSTVFPFFLFVIPLMLKWQDLSPVMSSHVEYKCIFIWVLKWNLFCCSCSHITICTEIGTLESSKEAISIWMGVSSGQHGHLQGVLSLQKVKMRLRGYAARCKIQTSPCVFSSSPTSWLKIYQTCQLWISGSIKRHEIKTSRSAEWRNCQVKKLDFSKPE